MTRKRVPTPESNSRDLILEKTRALLIGPLSDNEILESVEPESGPTDFYLTGILWPRNTEIGPGEDEKLEINEEGEEGETQKDSTPLYSVFRPSSIGVTLTLEGTKNIFEIILRGARYLPDVSAKQDEGIKKEKGTVNQQRGGSEEKSPRDWKRTPFEYRHPVTADEKKNIWRTNKFSGVNGKEIEDSSVTLHVKRRERDGYTVITASMINDHGADRENRDTNCLFQTEIEIRATAPDGRSGMIVSRPPSALPGEDELVNGLLYRNYREYAVGHGVSVVWPEPVRHRVSSVRTAWLPEQKVFSVTPEGHESLNIMKKSEKSIFHAGYLADTSEKTKIISGLKAFCDTYRNWIREEEKRLKSIPAEYKEVASGNLRTCMRACDRMANGVATLEKDPASFLAFQLANRAMDNQARGLQNRDRARPLVWRPFQLAFILLSLSSIVDRDSGDRQVMDLLWFPTGGGKTEAYLGLIALTIFHRRIIEPESGNNRHVDVIMRYTLRLLTVQQFQRAASMICAADLIRASDPGKLGKEPISLGLFVGRQATPNRLLGRGEGEIVSAEKAIIEERRGNEPASTPRLLLECPLCGASLTPEDYVIDSSAKNMRILCSNLPDCPARGNPLPVHTVDDEIYRVLPSLLIGTVDKFAQLPRKEELGRLFGIPGGKKPELIIQDELHLISGPLGTMTGLYETCIDELAGKDGVRPKIIGSTATIGRAQNQIRALFDRDVMQFPPSSIDAEDSFFAILDPKEHYRTYLGISSSGRSAKFTLQAVAAAFLCIGKYLEDKSPVSSTEIDPYWTCLLYFNSLRELGGASVMIRDDVPRSIVFYANRLGCNVRLLEREAVELTSRVPSTKIPRILKELMHPVDGDIFEGPPVDCVLASNMISVGVDIPRLGLMVLNGQPKSTSEFIQASSRIGRQSSGVVLTVYNAGRPRDMSHFEHFKSYHQALYRSVESTSVTPWSPRARDKALHAVFASMVRYLVPGMAGRFAPLDFNPESPDVEGVLEKILERGRSSGRSHATGEEIRDDLVQIISRWEEKAGRCRSGGYRLEYWATLRPFDNRPTNPHLMRGAEDSFDDADVWATPNSMREVEPSCYYSVHERITTGGGS